MAVVNKLRFEILFDFRFIIVRCIYDSRQGRIFGQSSVTSAKGFYPDGLLSWKKCAFTDSLIPQHKVLEKDYR